MQTYSLKIKEIKRPITEKPSNIKYLPKVRIIALKSVQKYWELVLSSVLYIGSVAISQEECHIWI